MSVNEEFGSSNYSIIQLFVKCNTSFSKNEIRSKNIKNAEWDYFREILASSSNSWAQALLTKDIDLVWSQFLVLVTGALDKVALYRLVSARSLHSTSRVRTALRYKRRAYSSLLCCSNLNNLIAYERSKIIA